MHQTKTPTERKWNRVEENIPVIRSKRKNDQAQGKSQAGETVNLQLVRGWIIILHSSSSYESVSSPFFPLPYFSPV